MIEWINLASWALIVIGSIFGVIGGIGMIRLPDFYTRLHACSVTDTGAAYFILGGLMLQGGLSMITAKLALIMLFLFLTSPVATHALTNTAYSTGLRPWRRLLQSESSPQPHKQETEPPEEKESESPPNYVEATPGLISPDFSSKEEKSAMRKEPGEDGSENNGDGGKSSDS